MASSFLRKSPEHDLKPGEQYLEFWVWPKGEDDKAVPIFRVRTDEARLKSGRLSGFWEDVRFAMWPYWDETRDVEKLAVNPRTPAVARAWEVETGPSNYRGDIPKESPRVSISRDKLAYKEGATEGAFCFDPGRGMSFPLKNANLSALVRAFGVQLSNRETTGDASDGRFPRLLWCPGTMDEDGLGDTYTENFESLKKWTLRDEGKPEAAGKIVYWNWREIEPAARR